MFNRGGMSDNTETMLRNRIELLENLCKIKNINIAVEIHKNRTQLNEMCSD